MRSKSAHTSIGPFDFSERHSILIHALPGTILNCVRHYRLDEDALIRPALYLRGLPARLLRSPSAPPLELQDFTLLSETDRSLAYGLKGAFWQTDYGLHRFDTPMAFLGDRDASVATLILSFVTEPATKGRMRLVTQTHVLCPTPHVWRRFLPYWLVIRPVSGLLRRRMLSQIKARCERGV
ncbi:hypothetical protein [Gluconobacter albidus]|uniref:DUF2867 domain-containing protein n=1 Tax=Gluconobacter albidus TaxID=318683 RepID=A0AAW3QVR2_9PROT|nr:hypothetical protein [Gluconobacter albidus]KXV37847.1 hypothetical protein AD941_09095 [Gluconobacter albidus]MCP1272787.1 hypothetical protein [Gluconobacter albidus]GBQ92393.1 hypothetical protein AA3250_2551 [Gluconobacter albidus NBRC 3250]GLQ68156.1 hypothetical protein GCM10007866_06040 [Gluconobacter albidus]